MALSMSVSLLLGLLDCQRAGAPVHAPPVPQIATAGGHHAELSWQESSVPVDSYNVYRASAVVRGQNIQCDSTWRKIASTKAPVTRYTDTTVKAGSAYCYSVSAVNPKGESRRSLVATARIPRP